MADSSYNSFLSFAGQAYGTDDRLLRAINQLENSGRTTFDVNTWDSNAAAGTPSGGPFQFIKPTFDAYARHAREANPAAWRGVKMDWHDPKAQALAASWAFAHGKGSAWSTFSRAKGMLGSMKSLPASRGAVQDVSGTSPGTLDDSALAFIFKDSPIIQAALSIPSAMSHGSSATPANGTPMSQAEGKGFFARRKGETGQQYLDRLLQKKFGLKHDPGNAQTTGGHHSGRGHYDGRATDFGNARNSPATLQAAEDWLEANRNNLVGGLKLSLYGANEDPNHADHLHAETFRSLRTPKQRSRFA